MAVAVSDGGDMSVKLLSQNLKKERKRRMVEL